MEVCDGRSPAGIYNLRKLQEKRTQTDEQHAPHVDRTNPRSMEPIRVIAEGGGHGGAQAATDVEAKLKRHAAEQGH